MSPPCPASRRGHRSVVMDQSTSGLHQPRSLHKRLYQWAHRAINQRRSDHAEQAPPPFSAQHQPDVSPTNTVQDGNDRRNDALDSSAPPDRCRLRFKVCGVSQKLSALPRPLNAPIFERPLFITIHVASLSLAIDCRRKPSIKFTPSRTCLMSLWKLFAMRTLPPTASCPHLSLHPDFVPMNQKI